MRQLFRASVLLGALLFAPSLVRAQQPGTATFTGTVVDAETGDPLPGANVFIATSMIGTTTNSEGRYRLPNVPLGAHRLYVSMLGYESVPRDLMLRQARVYEENFELHPTVLDLGEITVVAEGDPKWKKRYERFVRLFIGESPNALDVEITNPEVLDFAAKGEFTAFAEKPLVIENRALGYRIQYFLKEFAATPQETRYDGEPLFEEMTPDSPEQAAMWAAKRKQAFYGSLRHFLLAAIENRVEEQGFKMYHRPESGQAPMAANTAFGGTNPLAGNQRFPIKERDILKDGETPNEKVLDWPGYVEIVYTGELEDPSYLEWQKRPGKPKYQTSQLRLTDGPTVVDQKGDVLDPYGVTLYGYLAFERVADELPKEYRPWLQDQD